MATIDQNFEYSTVTQIINRKASPTDDTVHDANDLYSWLMDEFDELNQMDDPVPMSAQTPVEYTLINGWGITGNALKFIKNGAIKTDGWNNEISRLELKSAGYTNCVSTDVGKMVQDDAVDSGYLVDYNNAKRIWWIRTGGTGIAADSAMTIPTGTGAGTARIASDETGEQLWANIYSLGTIESSPYAEIYIEQDRATLVNSKVGASATIDWYARGHLDILILVKDKGTEIDGAEITVYGRHYGDLFDHFGIDLTAGGRNAVPVATGDDLNNDTEEVFLFYDGWISDFTVGEMIKGVTSGATAEVRAVTEWTSNTDGYLKLGNVVGTFQDNETLEIFAGTDRALVNGTIGETYLEYDQETGTFTVGLVVTGTTSGTAGTLRGLQDDGTTGKMAIEDVDGEYDDDEAITDTSTGAAVVDGDSVLGVKGYEDWDLKADAADGIGVWVVNGTLGYDIGTDEWTVGAVLTGGTLNATGIILAYTLDSGTWGGNDAAGTLTLANVAGTFEDNESLSDSEGGAAQVNGTDGLDPANTMDKAFATQSAYPYDIIIDCGERPLLEVYEYLKLFTRQESGRDAYTFESGVRKLLFASGGYVSCVETDVGKAVVGGSTSDSGILLAFDNTARIWDVLVDDPTGDWFDEAESVSITAGTGAGTMEGCSYLVAQKGEHYRIAYYGYTPNKSAPFGGFAGGVFFGARGVWLENVPGADSQNMQLTDSNGVTRTPPNYQDFTITAVVSGDRCGIFLSTGAASVTPKKDQYNIDQTHTAPVAYIRVEEEIPTDTPTAGFVRVVRRNATGDILGEDRLQYDSWNNDDQPSYSTFVLTGTTSENYDTDDTAYVPYIDEEATGTSVSETVVYVIATDRNVVARVRKKGILPFETAGVFGSGGYAVAAIRTTDGIVT